jgi:hypothetical protein
MVVRGWSGSVVTAVGVAAAAGAAQLGLGYGLDIVSWSPDANGLSSEAWIASLTWATWIAATSAITGALVADRIGAPYGAAPPPGDPPARSAPAAPDSGPAARPAPDPAPGPGAVPTWVAEEGDPAPSTPTGARPPAGDPVTRVLWRLVLATAAALGAGAAVALVAVPARVAEVAETAAPQAVAAGYAVLGLVVGLVVAVAALTARAVAANLIATTAWLWLLAVVAVVDGVLAGRDWSRVPLAFWEFTTADTWFRNILLPDAGLALAAALVIGALAALPAARRGDHPVGVVVSGTAGPLVLAASYLLAQPDLAGAAAVDLSRHLVTPYLLLAGLIGSLLASAVRPRSRTASEADPAVESDAPAGSGVPGGRPGADAPVIAGA